MCLILNHLLFAFKYTFLYLAQEMVQSQEFFLVVTSPSIFSTKILDGGNSTEFPDRAPWGGGSEDARRAVGTYCGSRRRQILLLRLRPVAPEVHAGAGLPSHGPPPSWKGLQWSNHQCVLCLALRIRRTLPKTFQEGSLTSAPRKTWSSPSRGGKEKGAWWRGARPAARGGRAPRPRVRCCSRLGALLPQTHGPRRTGPDARAWGRCRVRCLRMAWFIVKIKSLFTPHFMVVQFPVLKKDGNFYLEDIWLEFPVILN